MARSVAVVVAVALLATLGAAARGEPPAVAVVRGAELVYLRRGPGTSHQAFRTVARGTEVTVETIEGSWARIRTAEGETGYVNSSFLEIESGAVPADSTEEPTREPALEAAAAALPSPTPQASADARAKPVEEARASANSDPRTSAAPSESGGDVRADVRRLLALTEEMHRQVVGERALPIPAPYSGTSREAPGAASTLALTGAGLVVGFLIGTGYGRYQERNRRNRVRF